MKYIVTQYYEIDVEIEAESKEEAQEKAYWDENFYTVTATYDNRVGGPEVHVCNLDPLVEEAE